MLATGGRSSVALLADAVLSRHSQGPYFRATKGYRAHPVADYGKITGDRRVIAGVRLPITKRITSRPGGCYSHGILVKPLCSVDRQSTSWCKGSTPRAVGFLFAMHLWRFRGRHYYALGYSSRPSRGRRSAHRRVQPARR